MPHASKSPWIIHYDGSSCNGCDIEVLAALTPLYDAERFGVINTGNPKHADIFVVTGAINDQNVSVVRQIYDQMLEPKVVVACGACACGGGVYHTCYNVKGGTDTAIPVDVYVPGCAIRPEALIDGIVTAIGILDEKSKELNGTSSKPRGYADAGEGVYAPQADVAGVQDGAADDKEDAPAEEKAASQGGDGR